MTSKCNLKCFYCHSEGSLNKENKEISINGIIMISKLAASYGVKTVKLTGGEPLYRKDIIEIVKSIFSIKSFTEVSMVTNGQFLKEYSKQLKDAGLKRVNVSLPSLDSEKYEKITGGEVNRVLEGINEAVKSGLNPVKLNMVLLKGINDDEVDSMIEYAAKSGCILQIIELEPVRISKNLYSEFHKPIDGVEEKLSKISKSIQFRDDMHKRKIFQLDSTKVEVVHPIENTEFCYHCNRLRVTYDGLLKPCLMVSGNEVDVSKYLDNKDYDGLRNAFLRSVLLRKPFWTS